ncbi:cyclase [Mycobacterium sp. ACS1612]|uniref:adenylate/guanylate cyclase domain-containing protein n=1 Tax=Mycobacterium sp. ACS1612 TaxID=1834117 RepID=UPI0007FE779A|nr:adenylate/guanylate cyclase domain-containing protein [Mycobacterium sp. ACS1612]OBF27171.1 cyclase [Mycobacterium sp. ACS1612]
MTGKPDTVYARSGDVHLAYQVVGDRGPDLLFIPTACHPIDLLWDEPTVAAYLGRLASFSRLIVTDLLGVGSSDAVPTKDLPAMQSWTDGLIAVLDAVDSENASVFATAESALPTMLLTASHPERVRSLILWSAFARFSRGPGYPYGLRECALGKYVDATAEAFGTGAIADVLAPSWIDDGPRRRWWSRSERLAGGPGYFKQIYDLYMRSDVRPVLESIRAPTLLLHRKGDRHISTDHGRYLAERIPNARLVPLDGEDHAWFAGDAEVALGEIEAFVTGNRAAPTNDRVLVTVLFTDIVESTTLAASLGDEAWSAALSEHNRIVEAHVTSTRGNIIKFTGDGVFATFDGPARAISCARAIRDALGELGLVIRIGMHTGEVAMVGQDAHGIAVHIAARIMAVADPGEILVSEAVPPLVLGSGIAFTDRGWHELKGVPGRWNVLAVNDER